MKFGKLEDLSGIEFILPPDHPHTLSNLALQRLEERKIYLGGTMWNIPKWKGKIFPAKTKADQMGVEYCKQFNTIELNATHYKIHGPEIISKWKNFSSEEFLFCPKFPNLITHYRRFLNSEGLTDEFLLAISHFEEKLGPSFIQLRPDYSPKYADRLVDYLKTIPEDFSLAIEFRHPEWFTGNSEAEKVWTLIEERNISAVISATAGRRDALHMRMTSDTLILRFGGYDLDPSDEVRLTQWADRIQYWMENGLNHVHIWMHQFNSIKTPETCILFGKLLEEKTGISVKVPSMIQEQGSLF